MKLLNKKPKETYKTKLKTDQTLNLYISILLSIISIMICISIPFSAMESPSDIFKEREMYIMHSISKIVDNYKLFLDILIILLTVTLVYVSARMIIDAIRNTQINISPWIEMGKYSLPPKDKSERLRVSGIRHSTYL